MVSVCGQRNLRFISMWHESTWDTEVLGKRDKTRNGVFYQFNCLCCILVNIAGWRFVPGFSSSCVQFMWVQP